jgi:hypothetical protein
MAILFMSMKDDVICYIVDQDDPSRCWTMLQNLFETKSTIRILFLLNKMHTMHMEEGHFFFKLQKKLWMRKL